MRRSRAPDAKNPEKASTEVFTLSGFCLPMELRAETRSSSDSPVTTSRSRRLRFGVAPNPMGWNLRGSHDHFKRRGWMDFATNCKDFATGCHAWSNPRDSWGQTS